MNPRLASGSLVLAALARPAPAGAADAGPSDPVLAVVPAAGAETRRNVFRDWRPATRGRPLPADAELRCPMGCVVRTRDGSSLTLDPGAHIRVGQNTFVPLGEAFASLGRRFELIEGSVTMSVVADRKRPRTLVIAASGEAFVAARPGRTQVVLGPERTAIACLEGGARVKQGRAALDLAAEEATSIGGPGELAAPRHIAPAPKFLDGSGKLDDPQPLGLALVGDRGAPALGWSPAERASGYRLDIAEDRGFERIVASARLGAGERRFVARDLGEGSYFARLFSLAEDGVLSRASAPASVRVVSVRAPDGAYVDSARGLVVVPEGSSLSLSDPRELELSVDDRRFSPAPAAWTTDSAPHLVRVRRRGDYGHESRFRVEPRKLRAEVSVGPAWARWPEDAVDITVHLEDGTGRTDPSSVEPRLEVLLDMEPLEVEWKRRGSLLTAVLPPRPATEPTVVRVIVRDRGGALLGRSFLEIEPSTRDRPGDKLLAKQ